MATKIRLLRRGRKKYARYDIVVADSRSPRDGKFIEKIGLFNPNAQPIQVDINEERAFHWVMVGATPTDTTRVLLSNLGIMLKKHLQLGVLKGAITQEQADKKFQDWKDSKTKNTEAKTLSASEKKAADKKARLAAEAKVSEARRQAQLEKAKPPVEEPAAAAAEEGSDTPAAEGSAAE